MICGLTARMTTSAERTRATLSLTCWMPYCFAMSARRSARASDAEMVLAGTSPVCVKPLMSASPMLPAPRKATRLPLMLTPRPP